MQPIWKTRRAGVLGAATLAAFVLLLTASPALAREGGYWTYTAGNRDEIAVSGDAADYPGGVVPTGKVFLRSDALPAGSTLMEPGDETPHGGYVDASAKCKVCHAVHGAGVNTNNLAVAPATERLLRSTAAEACTFCHLTTNFASTVYEGVLSNYKRAGTGPRVAGTSGHMDRHQYTPYQGCPSCHSVHGAHTIPGSAILKDDPAKGIASATPVSYQGGQPGYGSFAQPVTNQRDFCQDCHNGVKRHTSSGITTIDNQDEFHEVFPECNSPVCHTSIATDGEFGDGTPGSGNLFTALNLHSVQFGIDATATRNGRSHVMTDATMSGGTQIAWSATVLPSEGVDAATNSCTTCHTSSGFPHLGSNQNLIDGLTNIAHLDGVCAGCHTDTGSFGTASAGVGKTY